MGLSFVGVSGNTFRFDSWVTPTIHGSTTTGDLMLAMCALKPYNHALSITSGWALLGSVQSGTIASGGNVGSVRVGVWWKIHDGSEANPAMGSTNTGIGAVSSWRKAAGDTWDLAWMGGGGDESGDAAMSIDATIDPGVKAGDAIVGYWGSCNAANLNSQPAVITVPGCTMGTSTSCPTQATTTVGDNIGGGGQRRDVSSGTSSGFANLAGTHNQVAQAFAAAFVRVRAVPPSGVSQAIIL